MIKEKLRKRRSKNSGLLAFLCIVLSLATIGYATLTTTLNINGSATIAESTWNIYFTNVRVFGGSVEPTTGVNTNNDTSLSFDVTLSQPNEYYKFLVDVENIGSVDAMIKTITMPSVSGNLEFRATYKDGTEIEPNDYLKTGERKTLLVELRHKNDISLSTTSQNIVFAINYGQADDFAKEPDVEYTVDDFINITNGASTELYTDGVQAEMYSFTHEATSQLEANVDYRYIGNSPQNYIKFNSVENSEEMWRIIGIFQTDDGKNRLKLIKDEKIHDRGITWDYKMSGVGNSNNTDGSNDWTDAQLMYFLNPDDIARNVALKTGYSFDGQYVKDANDTVFYKKGTLPVKAVRGAKTYSGAENPWRVSTEALTKVDSVKYYLGGGAYNSTIGHYGSTIDIYNWERGLATYNSRPTSWTGKVALMYPSDYAYTFAKGVDEICFNNPTRNCKNGSPDNSWLYKTYIQWTIASSSDYPYDVFNITDNGCVYNPNAVSNLYVRPVVYLLSDIKLSGSGTENDPYVIK